jgi:predicted nucleic acid-binding protein
LILVDTNAWVDHFRRKDLRLVQFLVDQRVHTCDVVLGEIRLGSGIPRHVVADLMALPRLPCPHPQETRALVDRKQSSVAGSGIGWADAEVILTAVRAGARIHSSDRAVRRVCRALGIPLA